MTINATFLDKDGAESQFDFIWEVERQRKHKLLALICRIAIGLVLTASLFSFINLFSGKFNPVSTFIILSTFGCFYTAYWLAEKGRYQQSSWLLVSITTLVIMFFYVTLGTSLPLLFLMLPVALAIVLIEGRGVLVISAICLTLALAVIVAQDLLKSYTPNFDLEGLARVHLFGVLALLPALIALLWLPARNQAGALRNQNEELILALKQLQSRQRANQQVAEQIFELAQQLRDSADKQTGGSSRQLDLITQLNSSAMELSSVAVQIASSAQYFNDTIQVVSEQTNNIEQTSSLAHQESRAGLQALTRTSEAGGEVNQLYEGLVENLSDLAGKSTSMRLILSLISNLAQETHLLALNASIEAAGAGEHGDRFAVIAQEVKDLATRSSQANGQVFGIVSELEDGISQSVRLVQEGQVKTQLMDRSVKEAIGVLKELQRVVEQTEEQAQSINQRMQKTSEQTNAVKTATIQQESASRQVVEALEILREVAQQSVQDSILVFSSASSLETTSQGLERRGLVLSAS